MQLGAASRCVTSHVIGSVAADRSVFTPLWLRQLRPQESCRHLTETNKPKKHNGTKITQQRLDLIGRAVIPSPTPRLSPVCLKLAPEGIGIRTKLTNPNPWRSERFLKRRLGVTLRSGRCQRRLPRARSPSGEELLRPAEVAHRTAALWKALAPDQRGRAPLPLGSGAPSTEERRGHGEDIQKKAADRDSV